jgi:hypothetical protein
MWTANGKESMDTEKKKRVQTLPKPAQLPLAQPAMPAE